MEVSSVPLENVDFVNASLTVDAGRETKPVITSNGGGDTAAVSVVENQTAVTTVTSTDVDGGPPLYAIVGGVDEALFSVAANSGVLTFQAAPNFESPVDSNADNVYEVTVQVSDGNAGIDAQQLSISVRNNLDPNRDGVVRPTTRWRLLTTSMRTAAAWGPTSSPFNLDVVVDGMLATASCQRWMPSYLQLAQSSSASHPQPPVHTDGIAGVGTNSGTPLVRLRLTTTILRAVP